jgi:hypothetical protein
MKRLIRDVWRTVAPILAGVALMHWAEPVGLATGISSLAPLMMMTGLSLGAIGAVHPLRRLLFMGLDMREFASKAKETPISSALVFVGMCIVVAAMLSVLGPSARAAELPPNARLYLPVLIQEQQQWWSLGDVSVMAAQVEQETCITLKHSKCWSPRAELRTSRERGVGLGQITKTARFDALAEMRAANPQALAAWSWDSPNLYDPRLQLTALVLMDRRNYTTIQGAATELDHQAMMLVAYNAGPGRVISDRAMCGATPACDRRRWFDNAEHTSVLPKQPASGYGQSFYAISRHYPRAILFDRRPRYVQGDVL